MFNPRLLFSIGGLIDDYPMVNATGIQITEALKRLEKTQSWLAEKMNGTDAAVHKWIATGQIGRERLVELARLLGLTVDQLLTGEPSPDSRLTEIVQALPEADRQMVFDFIQYRWERSESTIMEDGQKTKRYLDMMRSVIDDMKRRQAGTE